MYFIHIWLQANILKFKYSKSVKWKLFIFDNFMLIWSFSLSMLGTWFLGCSKLLHMVLLQNFGSIQPTCVSPCPFCFLFLLSSHTYTQCHFLSRALSIKFIINIYSTNMAQHMFWNPIQSNHQLVQVNLSSLDKFT